MAQLTVVDIYNIPIWIQQNTVNIQLNVRRPIFWYQKPTALIITTTGTTKVMNHMYMALILITHWIIKYFQMSPLTNEFTPEVHNRWVGYMYMYPERLGCIDVEIVATDT